jgi:hypothetical protein
VLDEILGAWRVLVDFWFPVGVPYESQAIPGDPGRTVARSAPVPAALHLAFARLRLLWDRGACVTGLRSAAALPRRRAWLRLSAPLDDAHSPGGLHLPLGLAPIPEEEENYPSRQKDQEQDEPGMAVGHGFTSQ